MKMDIMAGFAKIRPMLPGDGPPLPVGRIAGSPFKFKSSVTWKDIAEGLQSAINAPTFEEKFNRFVAVATPPVPDVAGLPAFRKKAAEVMAPILYKKYFPPVPAALANTLKG